MQLHIILYNANRIHNKILINACTEWHKLFSDLDIVHIVLSHYADTLGCIYTHSYCMLNVTCSLNYQHNLHDLEKQSNFFTYYLY
jgi:hypothetical protein